MLKVNTIEAIGLELVTSFNYYGCPKDVHNGASYVARLHGGEREKQILFYIFLFFYVLLDSHVPLGLRKMNQLFIRC